jgi:DNA-directed RNA polymerase specialized sigma subunit
MPHKLIIQEVRAMLERNWSELEIAHKLCITPAEVHRIIATFLS